MSNKRISNDLSREDRRLLKLLLDVKSHNRPDPGFDWWEIEVGKAVTFDWITCL